MKVLIITYYWPPAGGSGVQRWLKFVKYLQGFNIQPIVYTISNPRYPTIDDSLLNEIPENIEVLKHPIWEPTDLLFWKRELQQEGGISNASKNSFLSFIRGNFFIPDPKLFWIKPSVKYLQSYLNKNDVDVIISTGPPHSMHLIAEKLHQKNDVKWLADFRDPWSDIYYNKDFKELSFVKNRNKKLEKSVLKKAGEVDTSISSKYENLGVTEKELIGQIYRLDEIIRMSADQFDPSFLASYCYEMAKTYHRFNHDHRIIKAESEEAKAFRIRLCEVTGKVLQFVMELLGIEMPERM